MIYGDISHSRIVPSQDAEASNLPSGENATELTLPVCPSRVAIFVRVATSHSFTVSSVDPEANSVPSGENATELTPRVCPSRVAIFVRVATSHSFTVASTDPEARVVPSGEKARIDNMRILKGGDICSGRHVPQFHIIRRGSEGCTIGRKRHRIDPHVCPSRVAIFVRVATSHSFTVSSVDPEARVVPSGENATELTPRVCPSRVAIFVRVATSHSFTVASSGENATE